MTTQSNAFAALMTRLSLDEPRASAYLGVPVYTFRKWVSGERTPSSSVLRLLEVLGTIEALAPALHAGFLPGESGHVKKSRGKRSTDLVKAKNPV